MAADVKQEALYNTIGALNIITDSAIIVLAIAMMWNVHVLAWKRLVVIVTFSARFL